MDWTELLCGDRLGRERRSSRQDAVRSEFRRDADRITFSTAFRRLQDKTQVFPLADNDYVRTRLTHSLEVASVGRSLGARIGAVLCQRHRLEVQDSDFGDIVAAAALAHDLGNPPFGHSGEDAIRHWFATSPIARSAQEGLSEAECADFQRYEGNAQGFRLITRLQMPDNPGGMQLTLATLGAFTKYPRAAGVNPQGYRGASTKKFGFYLSEEDHFSAVAERCGLLRRHPQMAWWARHPLSFLVEAADDICYRLVDFEDGFRLGHLTYAEVEERFLSLIPNERHPRRLHEAHSANRRVQILRDLAIGRAIDEAADVFLANEAALLEGAFDQPLIETLSCAEAWNAIAARSVETIYATQRGVEIEAAGYEVLGGLLDVFVSALNDYAGRGQASPRSRKLLLLVPAETLGPDRQPDPEAYTRLLKMLDFVSGMTDGYAVSLYKKVRGISLPGQ